MRQYLATKERYPDTVLFFRMGDFYEMFFDDAIEAAALLDLTLTSRNKNNPNPIPMAGIPYHAANQYLSRLIKAGKKVAICEQMGASGQAKRPCKARGRSCDNARSGIGRRAFGVRRGEFPGSNGRRG